MRRNHATTALASALLVVTFLRTAHADNPTVNERINAAVSERRYSDALVLIGEIERATGPTLATRYVRAQMQLLSGRNAEADEPRPSPTGSELWRM